MALTEQVVPQPCIQLSERCVVWGEKTINKFQKAENLNITIDDISFDLLFLNPELLNTSLKEHTVFPTNW
jgi:hypothetical protein